MKRIALSVAVLLSATMPAAATHASTQGNAAKQSYCERIATIETEDGTTEVYRCYDLGGGRL